MMTSFPTTLTIDTNTANQRLDRFLRKYFRPYPDISLVIIFKAIRTGQIKINGKKCDQSTKLIEKYILTFHQSFLDLLTNKNPVEKKRNLSLSRGIEGVNLDTFQSRIISEDDTRLVINKPAGISIHPSQSTEKIQQPQSIHDLIKQYYSSRGFA
jgi:23S rRNA pseudouridine955/2504/2580 synthase